MKQPLTLAERFWLRVDVADGKPPAYPGPCWEWQGHRKKNGYGTLSYRIEHGAKGKTKTYHAHRLAWELAHGKIPDGMEVLHKCDNPACVNPAHLFLGSQSDNLRDALAKNRIHKGEAHYRAKLTDELARSIYQDHRSGLGNSELQSKYTLPKHLIDGVLSPRRWKHIK